MQIDVNYYILIWKKITRNKSTYESLKNPLKVYFVELINYQIRSISIFKNTFFEHKEEEKPIMFDLDLNSEQEIENDQSVI